MNQLLKTLPLIFLLFSCGSKTNVSNEDKTNTTQELIELNPEQLGNANIVLGKVEERSILSTLRVNGKIDVPPQNMVSVSIPMGGYLKSTKLLPGMKVVRGEIIATIEDQQYVQLQQDYLSAKSKLLFTENEYNRQKELNADKASSDKVFQQSATDYMAQKVMVKALAEKLELINVNPQKLDENSISRSINVYAPIDGYVSKINVNIGKYVNPADVVFELVNPTDIHLALTVFEKDIDKLYIGQKLKAFNNNNPEIKHDCQVLLIGQNLSAERSIEVHCHFDDYDKRLIPGMYMNAEIEIRKRNALTLPSDAIVSFDNKDYVFVAKTNNIFALQEITTGISEGAFTEITGNHAISNSQIVVKGAYGLLMALKNKQND